MVFTEPAFLFLLLPLALLANTFGGQRFRNTFLLGLRTWMEEHSDVPFLDLHETLSAHKEVEQVYYAEDTHWNPHGALLVSRYLHKTLAPFSEPLPNRNAYSVRPLDDPLDELANLLGMHWPNLPNRYALEPGGGFSWNRMRGPWDTVQYAHPRHQPFATEMPDRAIRLLIYRDSFFTSLQPFVSEFSGRAVFVWSYVHDPRIVEAERPDWVIDEFVERRLTLPPPASFLPGSK